MTSDDIHDENRIGSEADIIAQMSANLGESLKKSGLYTAYREAYGALSAEDAARLSDFKKKQASANKGDFNSLKHISHIYAQLTINRRISAFLEAERAICRLLTDVAETVCLPLETFEN